MRTSEQVGDFASALVAAQAEIPNPDRNRTVKVKTNNSGEYSFTYTTLDHVFEVVRPILYKHGLGFMQSPASDETGAIFVTTRIWHKSGQWIESDSPRIALRDKDGPQQAGSLVTYLKRYSICGLLGIATEEDDDGNAASGNTATTIERPACPACGEKKAVFKDKNGPGWYCWRKKEGCGHQWEPDAEKQNGKPKQDAPDIFDAIMERANNCELPRVPAAVEWVGGQHAAGKISSEQCLAFCEALSTRILKSVGDSPPDEHLRPVIDLRRKIQAA